MREAPGNLRRSVSFLLISSMSLAPTARLNAGSCDAADTLCGNTKDAISRLIQDPKCKSDASCVNCVGTALGDSQLANYCSAYASTSKSSKNQTIQTATYLTTAAVCGTACALMSTGTGIVGAGQALSKVCGGLGLAASGMELILALASNNLAGAAMGAVGAIGRAGKNVSMAAKKITATANEPVTRLKELSKVPSCANFAIYALLSGAKLLSGKSMKKAADSQCDVIGNFGKNANAAVQSCQLGKGITPPPSTGSTGMFAATAESFTGMKVADGVKTLGVSATDQFIKDMKNDLTLAEEKGKVNFGDFADRVEAGEGLESLLAGTGAPDELLSAVMDGDARMQKGERLKALDGIGDGYSSPDPGSNLASTGSGTSEMGFGNTGASPGESAQSIEIDRAPGATASGPGGEGDILHAAFSGSIFEIVSLRIQERKGEYAEAEPEGRMNRVFNGYRDKDRRPAAKSGK